MHYPSFEEEQLEDKKVISFILSKERMGFAWLEDYCKENNLPLKEKWVYYYFGKYNQIDFFTDDWYLKKISFWKKAILRFPECFESVKKEIQESRFIEMNPDYYQKYNDLEYNKNLDEEKYNLIKKLRSYYRPIKKTYNVKSKETFVTSTLPLEEHIERCFNIIDSKLNQIKLNLEISLDKDELLKEQKNLIKERNEIISYQNRLNEVNQLLHKEELQLEKMEENRKEAMTKIEVTDKEIYNQYIKKEYDYLQQIEDGDFEYTGLPKDYYVPFNPLDDIPSGYCETCMESPCMCSDREKTSSRYDY